MTLSPRTPVLVGNAELTIREPDLDDPVEPLEMMRMTAASAARDAGSDRLLERASIVAVVRGAWSYSDPGRSLARSLGAPSAHTILTTAGGQTPQALLNAVFGRIARGDADVVLLAGAEAIYSRKRLRRGRAEACVERERRRHARRGLRDRAEHDERRRACNRRPDAGPGVPAVRERDPFCAR